MALALLGAAPAQAGFTFDSTFGGLPDLSASGAAGRLNNPFQVDAAADGTVYVVDRENERISKFSPAGIFERAWGKDVLPTGGDGPEVCTTSCQQGEQGSARGELRFAWGIALSPDGNQVYVADYLNRRIQQFTTDGTFVRMWGRDVNATEPGTEFEICEDTDTCKVGVAGTGPGHFDEPVGISVAPSGEVYVADRDNNRVEHFSATGAFIRAWGWDVDPAGDTGFEICTTSCKVGTPGGGDGQFDRPGDVAVDGAGVVTVISENDSAQRFTAGGTFLSRYGALGVGPGQMNDPRSIDIADDGEIFIAQTTTPSAVHRFRGAGEFFESFDENATILDNPSDVAPATPGYVYIVKSQRNRVDRFALSEVTTPPPASPPPDEPEPPAPAPGPAPAPAPATPKPAGLPPAASVISLPSARKCVSRRNFRIRLRKPKGLTIREALVLVNGRRVRTVRGKRLTAPVDLRGLPKGRFTVKITIVISDGRKLSGSRRYRTCARKR